MGQICFRRMQWDAGSSSHRLEKVGRAPTLLSEVMTAAREQPRQEYLHQGSERPCSSRGEGCAALARRPLEATLWILRRNGHMG